MHAQTREDWTRIAALVAILALLGALAFHSWYTSDAARRQRMLDRFTSLPGVEQVDSPYGFNPKVRLADDVTLAQARDVYAAYGDDGGRITLGAAEMRVYWDADKSDTRGVDLLHLAGTAGTPVRPDAEVAPLAVVVDSRRHGATLDVRYYPFDELLDVTRTLVEAFTSHPDLLPPGTELTSGQFTLVSASELADPARARRDVAAATVITDLAPELADLYPQLAADDGP